MLPLAKVPVAANCIPTPSGTVAGRVDAATAIDTSGDDVTRTVAELLVTPWYAAVIVEVPGLCPVAIPLVVPIVATAGLVELHVTTPLMNSVLPSL